MEVAIKARHHQQLLEHLRRLRQRVKLAVVNSGRNQKVAGTFGARSSQNRGLKFCKALVDHASAEAGNDFASKNNVRMKLFASQIQKAVAKTDFFRIFRVSEYRQRQVRRLGKQFDRGGTHFDFAGWQVFVERLGTARGDSAVHHNDRFASDAFR